MKSDDEYGDRTIAVSKAAGGRSLVLAADKLDAEGWFLVLAFLVGDGLTNLISHTVMRRPEKWDTSSPAERKDWLMSVGEYVIEWPPPPGVSHLTTAVVRSAATTQLERSTRNLIARRGPGIWNGLVEPGSSYKSGPQRGEVKLAAIAQRYVELHASTKNPKAALAKEKHAAVNTVNSWLYKARDKGLLTSAGQGRPGGQLTEKAIRLLSEVEQ